jgi:hypothetical protein
LTQRSPVFPQNEKGSSFLAERFFVLPKGGALVLSGRIEWLDKKINLRKLRYDENWKANKKTSFHLQSNTSTCVEILINLV